MPNLTIPSSLSLLIIQANEFFCGLSIPDPGTIEPLENKLPRELGSEGVDFTLRCLDKDPARRWSCEQLLMHPYFKNFSFKFPETEEEINRRNFNSGGMLLPHLPHNGGSQNGSPDIRYLQARTRHHKETCFERKLYQSCCWLLLPTGQ